MLHTVNRKNKWGPTSSCVNKSCQYKHLVNLEVFVCTDFHLWNDRYSLKCYTVVWSDLGTRCWGQIRCRMWEGSANTKDVRGSSRSLLFHKLHRETQKTFSPELPYRGDNVLSWGASGHHLCDKENQVWSPHKASHLLTQGASISSCRLTPRLPPALLFLLSLMEEARRGSAIPASSSSETWDPAPSLTSSVPFPPLPSFFLSNFYNYLFL